MRRVILCLRLRISVETAIILAHLIQLEGDSGEKISGAQ